MKRLFVAEDSTQQTPSKSQEEEHHVYVEMSLLSPLCPLFCVNE
jgi:hypothetical protein